MSYLSYNYIYKIKSVFIVSRDFIYLSILNPSLPIFSKIKRIRQTLANLVTQRCPGQHWVLVKERLTSTVFLGPFYIKLTSVFLRAILHGQQKAESEGCPYMPWVKLSAYQDSAELLWRCRDKAFLNIYSFGGDIHIESSTFYWAVTPKNKFFAQNKVKINFFFLTVTSSLTQMYCMSVWYFIYCDVP